MAVVIHSTSKNADQLFTVDENSVNGTTDSIFILYHLDRHNTKFMESSHSRHQPAASTVKRSNIRKKSSSSKKQVQTIDSRLLTHAPIRRLLRLTDLTRSL